ncbi:MAG: LysR family transcriptional regulator [Alphaproteobacteria bacterium]|nr:LysR family transcriptional regulator [Alphaproteobacteria bacterium]
MKDSLREGLQTARRFTIDQGRTIDFLVTQPIESGTPCAAMDPDAADTTGRVYATPSLVRDIETTCREMLLEHLEPGEDSLGTRVDIEHLAPTLLDMWVDITATVREVDGRAVVFDVTARDPIDDLVARGRHHRFVIDVSKTKERLAAKAAKAA